MMTTGSTLKITTSSKKLDDSPRGTSKIKKKNHVVVLMRLGRKRCLWILATFSLVRLFFSFQQWTIFNTAYSYDEQNNYRKQQQQRQHLASPNPPNTIIRDNNERQEISSTNRIILERPSNNTNNAAKGKNNSHTASTAPHNISTTATVSHLSFAAKQKTLGIHPTRATANNKNNDDNNTTNISITTDTTATATTRTIRVACVGDSLTRGDIGATFGRDDYPSQLERLLNSNYSSKYSSAFSYNYQVRNFGKNAVTVLTGLDHSYTRMHEYADSIQFHPHIVLIWLGTNDVKRWHRHSHRFESDYVDLIQSYHQSYTNTRTNTSTRIILGIPPWTKKESKDLKLTRDVIPAIQRVANNATSLQLLPLSSALVDMRQLTFQKYDSLYTKDGIHLNAQGFAIVAKAWQERMGCDLNGVCDIGEDCHSCPQDCTPCSQIL